MATTRRQSLMRGGAILALVLALIAAGQLLPLSSWLESFQRVVRDAGAWGPVLYALVYALSAVLFVPATILSLGAGALFGPLLGTLVVAAGATGAATISFTIARLLLRDRVNAAVGRDPRFVSLDRAIAREGWRIVLLVRLSPIFPFTWVNYAFGLTGVTARAYLVATVTGMLPGVVAIVYVGHAGGTLVEGASVLRITLQVIGAAATIAVAWLIGRIAGKELRKAGVDGGSVASAAEDATHARYENGNDRSNPAREAGDE